MKNINKITILGIILVLLSALCLVGCKGGGSSEPETINGIVVPPDPGEEGKKTLAGIDSNNNGVRDDVERAIAEEFGSDRVKYDVAFEHAQTLDKLYSPGDKEKAVTGLQEALRCLNGDEYNYTSYVSKEYKNTQERSRRSSLLLGGMLISTSEEGCE